jgi:hypothetical protein
MLHDYSQYLILRHANVLTVAAFGISFIISTYASIFFMRFTTKRAQWIVLTKFSTMVKTVASVTPSYGDRVVNRTTTQTNKHMATFKQTFICIQINRNFSLKNFTVFLYSPKSMQIDDRAISD